MGRWRLILFTLTATASLLTSLRCASPSLRASHGLPDRPRPRPFLNMPPNDRTPAPLLLSQTGAFSNVRELAPEQGLIPYDLNAAFWSDGAAKMRWMALPARIGFSPNGEWTFPPGTVFVKHFELPTGAPGARGMRRLETRLLVRDDSGGVYGVSYRWRADASDADRVDVGRLEHVEIQASDGVSRQNWYFPGPMDCRTCHTPQAGLVLGVKTRQLNRPFVDPATGVRDNQLRAWARAGLLDPAPAEREILTYPALAAADEPGASLEDRARSYLDANCSHCHRPGGVSGFFDARYDTPLARQNLIDGPVLINLGLDRARLIAPNDVWRSVLHARLITLQQPKMPPLAHEVIDERGAALLSAWIQSLPGPPVLPPPVISPAGETFNHPVTVTIRHPDPGSIIRYTVNGSIPDKTAPIYTSPLIISEPTTLRAKAFKEGATRSITVQETFIVEP